MHQSSLANMSRFRDAYLASRKEEPLHILDIGSSDINGSYRHLFESPSWHYVGADVSPGKNVDRVLDDPYRWRGIRSETVDVLISGQALEHVEYCWLTLLEMARVLKVGGLCCLIAPSGGFEHRYPLDCWRFYPDGFLALARFAGLVPLECRCGEMTGPYTDDSDLWRDTVLIARKPAGTLMQRCKRRLLHWAIGSLIPGAGSAESVKSGLCQEAGRR